MERSRSRNLRSHLEIELRNLPHRTAALLPTALILTPKPSFIHEGTPLAAYPDQTLFKYLIDLMVIGLLTVYEKSYTVKYHKQDSQNMA